MTTNTTINTTLAINFYSENITEELRAEFMQAVAHENCDMNIQILNEAITKLEKKIANENGVYLEEEIQLFKVQKNSLEVAKDEFEADKEATLEVYTKVVEEMSKKNEHGFGNSKDNVRTVLRVLATWDNAKLVKYAIIPCFKSPQLYEALETIHVLSVANEDGCVELTDEVKTAYKNASKELESIIKNTFSLPFETAYTSKTRVKVNADDKKLLNDCYIKGFSNKFAQDDDGVVTFKKRQINTLVKAKKNRKTNEVTYDYSGLASTISNIVIKHYFA